MAVMAGGGTPVLALVVGWGLIQLSMKLGTVQVRFIFQLSSPEKIFDPGPFNYPFNYRARALEAVGAALGGQRSGDGFDHASKHRP